jgi:signal transduction histidine kinase
MTVGEGVAELTIQQAGEEITVRLARQFIVGSRPDADLVVEGIPPSHFVINPSKNGALLLVIEQPERVLLNQVPARQVQRLVHGDMIATGDARLTYSSPSDSNPLLALSREPTPRARHHDAAPRSSIYDSQNISWFTAESDLYRALRTLYQLSALSGSTSSESALLEGALDLALQGGRASAGAIVGKNERDEAVPIFVRAPEGATPPELALDQVDVAMRRGHTSVVGPPDGAPALCAPILRPGTPPEGALCLKRAEGDTPFSVNEVELVASVGRQLGIALERVRVLTSLRSSALELQKLQRRHEAVLCAITEGLVLVAADRTVEPLSERGRLLLGTLLGRAPAQDERLAPDGPIAQLVARAAQGERRVVQELEAGEERIVRVDATRVDALDAVVLVLSDVTHERELEEQSREAEARLLTELVRGREQRRIGQDLHDGVCQQLVGMQMLVKGLERELALAHRPEAGRAGELCALLRQTAEEARALARGLTLVATEERSFLLALQELITTFRRLSPRMVFRFESTGTLPPIDATVATQLYHITQEALSNACKHSGGGEVAVDLACDDEAVVLTVEDDGVGLPAQPERAGGMGLGNMRHRARLIGATLELTPGARGTRVVCSLRTNGGRGA